MASSYEKAVTALYQAAHGEFVQQRKRLAAELAAAGHKTEAAKLTKLPRPSISVWVVNQLWWKARAEFEVLFESSERLREGDLKGTAAYRKASNTLVSRAEAILTQAGHAASEATLRRVSATLAALAAAGGFEPDTPGALTSDRDPPGFEAVGIGTAAEPGKRPTGAKHERGAKPTAAERERAEAAERERRAEERARIEAERRRLEAALRGAQAEVKKHTRELERLREEVAERTESLERAEATATELEGRLKSLDDTEE